MRPFAFLQFQHALDDENRPLSEDYEAIGRPDEVSWVVSPRCPTRTYNSSALHALQNDRKLVEAVQRQINQFVTSRFSDDSGTLLNVWRACSIARWQPFLLAGAADGVGIPSPVAGLFKVSRGVHGLCERMALERHALRKKIDVNAYMQFLAEHKLLSGTLHDCAAPDRLIRSYLSRFVCPEEVKKLDRDATYIDALWYAVAQELLVYGAGCAVFFGRDFVENISNPACTDVEWFARLGAATPFGDYLWESQPRTKQQKRKALDQLGRFGFNRPNSELLDIESLMSDGHDETTVADVMYHTLEAIERLHAREAKYGLG